MHGQTSLGLGENPRPLPCSNNGLFAVAVELVGPSERLPHAVTGITLVDSPLPKHPADLQGPLRQLFSRV